MNSFVIDCWLLKIGSFLCIWSKGKPRIRETVGGHQVPYIQSLQDIFVTKALWECRSVFMRWEQYKSKKVFCKEEGKQLMNHTSSQLWCFVPWGWKDSSLYLDAGPSYSFVLDKLFHFSSRRGSFREQPRSSPVGWWGATGGDSLGVTWSCTNLLRSAAGRRN